MANIPGSVTSVLLVYPPETSCVERSSRETSWLMINRFDNSSKACFGSVFLMSDATERTRMAGDW